jgi:hypothetical protein
MQLLSGYCHQDWDVVHGTEAQAIADYIQTNWRDEVGQAIEENNRYLREHPSGLLTTFEAEFDPMIMIGVSDDEDRTWLFRIRNQLQSDLMEAPSRSI